MKKLNYLYYGMAALTVLAYTVLYLLITKGYMACIDPQSQVGVVLQYVVIFDALLTIPLGLFWFKRQCDRIRLIEDEQLRTHEYIRKDYVRIALVSNSMLVGIIAFCLMGFYRSMVWIAAIGAIGWYFTKPTEAKMQQELAPKQDQY